jgi:aspartyl-tRNA(Asn)/glutamyl-tRNA(Gln) amidotransferase subunit C
LTSTPEFGKILFMELSDLEVTAALARVGFSREELETARPAFEQMLGYFEQMAAADNDVAAFGKPLNDVEVKRRTVDSANLRSDVNTASPATADAIISRGEDTDGRFFVIPNVL